MPSPLSGVWELMSDTDKGLMIHTETHYGIVIARQQGRRGLAGTYTVEKNRIQAIRLVDTATTGETSMTFEFQRDGDMLTTKPLTASTMVPAGHVDIFCKIADLTMPSPFAGVWQLLSETDKSLNIRTDTHWVTIMDRGDYRRGMAGTYTVEGNRVSNAILVDTALNAPSHIEIEQQFEGDTVIVKCLAGTLSVPAGHVDRWRKIG